MAAYSFLNVQANIVGPGGSFALGQGAGASEEGITISYVEDKNTMTVGADGSVMHSLHAGKAVTVTVRLLKTSPTNAALSQMYNLQTISAAAHGLNTIVVQDSASGDVITVTQAAFKKHPDLVYAKDGNTNEWTFDGVSDSILGNNLAAAAAAFAASLG